MLTFLDTGESLGTDALVWVYGEYVDLGEPVASPRLPDDYFE